MKRILKTLKKFIPKEPQTTLIANKRQTRECTEHNVELYPNIKSNESCKTCKKSMCYICGHQHQLNGCHVDWGRYTVGSHQHVREITNDSQYLLNFGYVGTLFLEELECPCGTRITSKDESAQCTACGTWTCSKKCHDKYLVSENRCTFHHNFTKDIADLTMRSIRLKSIINLQKNNFAPGTAICKTSKSFLFAVISDEEDKIYVQRGYRQFGQMMEGTIKAMEIEEQENVDYFMLKEKLCSCDCDGCKTRKMHPIYNCRHECFFSETQVLQDYINDHTIRHICNCDCEFCQSGKMNIVHRKIDCLLHCHMSEVKTRDWVLNKYK